MLKRLFYVSATLFLLAVSIYLVASSMRAWAEAKVARYALDELVRQQEAALTPADSLRARIH
jgi:hypothetical protein